MALEKFRRKGLYDKQNAPLSNEEIKKVIKEVKGESKGRGQKQKEQKHGK